MNAERKIFALRNARIDARAEQCEHRLAVHRRKEEALAASVADSAAHRSLNSRTQLSDGGGGGDGGDVDAMDNSEQSQAGEAAVRLEERSDGSFSCEIRLLH